MRKYYFYLLLVLIIGCKKQQEKKLNNNKAKSEFSQSINFKSKEKVNSENEKEIENWKELQTLHVFMERFTKTSAREILSNALELRDITKSLKDSIKPKLFNTASFNARINIMHNESLRLSDMTFIPAIKAKEVITQSEKIMTAYSGINSKINAVLAKKRFEDAIDVEIKFIGLDSTKIDSVTRKSIKENTLNKELEN